MSDSPIYHLQLTMRGARVETYANGLPLATHDARAGAAFSTPVNANLVGKDNRLRIVALTTLREGGGPTTPDDLLVEGAVKRYAPGDVAGPGTGTLVAAVDFGEVLVRRRQEQAERLGAVGGLSADEIEARLRVTFPVEAVFTFDNDGPAFRGRFLDAPAIEDEGALREYAELLRYLMARQEAERLYREFRPKLDDYNAAYPADAADDAVAFPAFLREQFFPSGPVTDFKPEDVRLRSWCGGRIWEPCLAPDRPLFTTAGLNDYVLELRVFVGLDQGRLKVVR